ncbi:MAG TPA: terminase family protein [Kofleriaceae bacterium]|nr:terminase family protein [Kofleriaceae bacterium]
MFWLLLAGRGFGKTRTAGEWVRKRVAQGARHIILAGATAGDLRDIMIEGESGILAISPPWDRPIYEPSKCRLTWPNGARAELLSADEPERFRGRQSDTIWADELGAWRYPEAWNQLMFGFRLGDAYGVKPRAVISTTPRPIPLIRELLKDPLTRVVVGSTYENRSNLAKTFIHQIASKYEGTRLGRQELYAEILDDVPGALWARSLIERLRVKDHPPFRRVVVAIDPSVTAKATSDECGIVAAGLGMNGHGYVLDDVSGRMTPREWGIKAVTAFRGWQADRIVAEVNNGGDLVEVNLRTIEAKIPYRGVHAARGKRTRAEPVASLYERGLIHHVGMFARLEDEMCSWDPTMANESPNRIDALVWAITELMLEPQYVARNLVHLPPQ